MREKSGSSCFSMLIIASVQERYALDANETTLMWVSLLYRFSSH